MCYYQITTANLNTTWYRYYIDISYETMDEIIIQQNNGTSTFTASDPLDVDFFSGYDITYKMLNSTTETNDIFLVFTGQDTDENEKTRPAIKASITLREVPIFEIVTVTEFIEGEVITNTVYVYIDEEPPPRIQQHALTILIAAITLSVILFLVVDKVFKC